MPTLWKLARNLVLRNRTTPESAVENSRKPPRFSIVICSVDALKFNRVCESYRHTFRMTTFEIIGIHDARSLAEGYNRGIAKARGEFIIFSHDDIRVLTPDFADRVETHLGEFDIIGVAGTTRVVGGAWFLAGHPYDFVLIASPDRESSEPAIYIKGAAQLVIPDIQGLDGVLICARSIVARELLFDEVTFDNFHLYDLDFTFRAYLSGYRLAVCRDLLIFHESHGTFDELWGDYALRFESKFRNRLPTSWAKTESHLAKVIIGTTVFGNEQAISALADPRNLRALLALAKESDPE